MTENIQSFHGPLSERVRSQVMAYCSQLSGHLLDVGCGNGLLFDDLAAKADLKCYGVDRSVELLTAVRQRHQGEVGCTNGMMDHLPFHRGSFEVVTCLNTLLNFPSLDVVSAALHEMMRISTTHVIVDIRNGDNPYMRTKYWWHGRSADFSTVAYRLKDIDAVFQSGGFRMEQSFPIGIGLRLLAWGYVVVARRTTSPSSLP